jgi:hypothetical protein
LELEGLKAVAFQPVNDDFGEELRLDRSDAAGAVFLMFTDPHLKPLGKVEGKPVTFRSGEERIFPLSSGRHTPLRFTALASSP